MQRGFGPRTSEWQGEESYENCVPGRNAKAQEQKNFSQLGSRKAVVRVERDLGEFRKRQELG